MLVSVPTHLSRELFEIFMADSEKPKKKRPPTPVKMTEVEQQQFLEVAGPGKCMDDCAYFLHNYCWIESIEGKEGGSWIPFKLWPAQVKATRETQDHLKVIDLKARQVGDTWRALGFGLWHMLFKPIAKILLFSLRDDEAIELMRRLRGMHDRLPPWLKSGKILTCNSHEWQLLNGSTALAFPTTAGDSYTATLAIVDEADLVPDLDRLMRAVQPTIDAGGRMILLSRADKSKPESVFKKMFIAAKEKRSDWHPIFLPWHARPDRTQEWYEAQKRNAIANTGSLDNIAEQYPATIEEALAPRSMDKRIPFEWLKKCYVPINPLVANADNRVPSVPGLNIYQFPMQGKKYVIGADPAGGKSGVHGSGNPSSDFSSAEIVDVASGEEVATIMGRFEPATFASYIDQLAVWYGASVMVERNNHGCACILWFKDNGKAKLMEGTDGNVGWLTTTKSKAIMYGDLGEALRDSECLIHSVETFMQLASIEGSTLRSPVGMYDDRAVAFALAITARASLLKRWVDIHKVLDQLIEGGKPDAKAATGQLPVTDKGGVQWVAPFEEHHLYLNRDGNKIWIFASGHNLYSREEAEYAGVVLGLWEESDNLGILDEPTRSKIAQAVKGKVA